MKLLYIPVYMAILCLMACNKSKDLPVDNSKLKKVTNGVTLYEFAYDQQGRLSKLTAEVLWPLRSVEYVYDGESKRVRNCKILETATDYQLYLNYARHFSYDERDRLVSIELKKNDPAAPDHTTVLYGSRYEFQYPHSDEKYSSCIIYCKDQLREYPYRMHKFWYDFSGNFAAISTYHHTDGKWDLSGSVHFGYSTVPNPFYQNTDPLDFEMYCSKLFWVRTKNNSPIIIGFPVTGRQCTMNGLRLESATDNLKRTTRYEYY